MAVEAYQEAKSLKDEADISLSDAAREQARIMSHALLWTDNDDDGDEGAEWLDYCNAHFVGLVGLHQQLANGIDGLGHPVTDDDKDTFEYLYKLSEVGRSEERHSRIEYDNKALDENRQCSEDLVSIIEDIVAELGCLVDRLENMMDEDAD